MSYELKRCLFAYCLSLIAPLGSGSELSSFCNFGEHSWPRTNGSGATWLVRDYMVFFGFSALDCLATIMSLILS